VSWSPDNTKVLTASGDKTAKIWNIASGEVETYVPCYIDRAARYATELMDCNAVMQHLHVP